MTHGFAAAFLLAVLTVTVLSLQPPAPAPAPEPPPATLTPQSCAAAGGHWEECGSPCIGTDAKVCVTLCDAQCQCGGIAGFACPTGFSCRLTGAIADELGKCIPAEK